MLYFAAMIANFNPDRALALAQQTFDIEAQAVLGLKSQVSADFARAVEMVLGCTGRVVVSGMGKSGHIARKIAATLASTAFGSSTPIGRPSKSSTSRRIPSVSQGAAAPRASSSSGICS